MIPKATDTDDGDDDGVTRSCGTDADNNIRDEQRISTDKNFGGGPIENIGGGG
ncbi:unnamed protein product, partial [Rotaria magnacalcarata]